MSWDDIFGFVEDIIVKNTSSPDEAATATTSHDAAPFAIDPFSSDWRGKCSKGEWSEPDFHLHACEASKIVSWIAAVFLLSMIVFGVTKCLTTHGLRKIFDLRLTGVSFPQRPEFFVLLCSSLPLVFTVLTRPLFTPMTLGYDIFIRGWGLAQTRFFLDLFTRTASVYHMVYWAYRTPIINCLWKIKLYIDFCHTKWKDRPKPVRAPRKTQPRKSSVGLNKDGQTVRRHGRTKEHGYGKKRARSKSMRAVKSGANSITTQSNADLTQQQDPQQSTHVINTGGVNVIAPQRLFTGQANIPGMMMTVPGTTPLVPYNSNMMNFSGMNMYNPMMGMQPSSFGMGMGYDMSMGMGMVPPNFPQQGAWAMGQNTMEMSAAAGSESATKQEPPKEPAKPVIPSIPPTRVFSLWCKRIIPGVIYLLSFVITIPSILAFELDSYEWDFSAARCTQRCRSYFYYDLVVIVTIPMILITVVFYHSALAKKQLNGGTKMTYRLRCYYVTFILLNIPMFVLMLTSIGFRLTGTSHRDIYGTGILIAMTAYHANFALKTTVYTTACNCICCTDSCLERLVLLNRLLIFFTTPVAVKDKKKLMEGTVISVGMADTKT